MLGPMTFRQSFYHQFLFPFAAYILRRRNHCEMDGDGEEDQRIDSVIAESDQLESAITSASYDWDRHVARGREIIARLDQLRFLQGSYRFADQSKVIMILQRLAYYEPDAGGVQDIAEWCQTQWLRLLQLDSDSIEALNGEDAHRRSFQLLYSKNSADCAKAWVRVGSLEPKAR